MFDDSHSVRRHYGLAMTHAMDRGLGRIRELLAEQGMTENTLILFISDNDAPLLSQIDNRDTIEGNGWTGSFNNPLRGEKDMLSEGGIRVPFVLAMPGVIPGDRMNSTPVSTLDLAPTFLASAGAKNLPAELEGENLWPLLLDGDLPERSLFWRFWGQSAVRQDPWKLLVAGNQQWLFNLEIDKEEANNLSTDYPERVESLRRQLQQWKQGNRPVRPIVCGLNKPEQRWLKEHLPN